MNEDMNIETIELNIKEAERMADLARSVKRLRSNRDFKKIIMEGYFENEPVRLVMLKSDPQFQSEERQQALLKEMDGIGSLRNYLQTILTMGNMAEKEIADSEQELELMRAEEAEGDA
ncbi:hypothetical protein [Marinobacterium litorale]|uniref:hypothetical protein n=1 Tax=Marinobacterium litorale TaxID=404770 RepID=UPI0004205EAD|nr:hypothetical protein [Marinobacterium litorale]